MLKKIVLLFFAVAVLLFLVSCTRDPGLVYLTEETVSSGEEKEIIPYTYTPDLEDSARNVTLSDYTVMRDVPSAFGDDLYFHSETMVYKLNKETGKLNPMCKDPICQHNEVECPFYVFCYSFGFYFYNGNMIYMQGGLSQRSIIPYKMLCYNVENGSFKTIFDYQEDSNGVNRDHIFDGGFVYFTDKRYDKEADKRYEVRVKLDLSTLKAEDLETADYLEATILAADENNFYIRSVYDKNVYIAKNKDLNDRVLLLDDHYSHFSIFDGNVFYISSETGNITSKKLDCSEKKTLGIANVDRMFVTEKYIYYRLKQPTVIGKYIESSGTGKKTQKDMIINTSAIYRCTHDGENIEVVYEMYDGKPLEKGESVFMPMRVFVHDGYFYTAFVKYFADDEGFIDEEYSTNEEGIFSYMRVNCNTGEMYIIEMPEI